MKSPVLSAVIATYNRSKKLVDAVKSVEGGSFPKNKIEILIVDDCSTDNTKRVVEDLTKKYRNIKYLRTSRNSGPAAARNIGIKHSKGEYVFFTDDDCIVSKGALLKYVEFLNKNPKVAGIGGILVPASDNLIARIELIKDKVLGIDNKRFRVGRDVPVGFTCNMIYRREIFRETGYFNENFKVPAGEDLELKQRVAKNHDLAVMPVIVKHNHDYNIDYLLSLLFKQGLDKTPPRGRFSKIFLIILYSPILFFKILKKTLKYRGVEWK